MREKILNLFNEYKFLKKEEISKYLNASESEIEDELNLLCEEYILYKNKKDLYGLLSSFNYYLGKVNLKKEGYGFFRSLSLDEDVFISMDGLGNALDNDTVIAWCDINAKNRNRLEGRVIKVLKHGSDLICKVKKKFHTLDNKILFCDTYPDVKIITSDFKDLKEGDIALVKVKDVDLIKKNSITVDIIKKIGSENDKYIDIKSIYHKYGLKDEFDSLVNIEASKIYKKYEEEKDKESKRREHIDRQIITIDGKDAKDLDDAISVKRLDDNTYFLGVYIADVSYFVSKGSKIDIEALNRGTSVYLIDIVLPMLPVILSNNLCSLNPLEEKYVIALEAIIDAKGNTISSEIKEAIIKSNYRMNYDDVNDLIDYLKSSDKANYPKMDLVNRYEDLLPMIQDMKDLSSILREKKRLRGALDFDLDEAYIILSDEGKAVDVKLKNRYFAEKLIEDFMVEANEIVASTINSLDLPFIYRVHDMPSDLKIEKFNNIIGDKKYRITKKGKTLNAYALQHFLSSAKDDNPLLGNMILRMMAKAKYSKTNIGHFGLASKCYTHFTSPIRRYPDLLVHRLIRKYIINSEEFYSTLSSSSILELENEIERIAKNSSEREVNANLCEFEVLDMKKAEYMEDRIGFKYEGVITSVLNFGFFVSLENTIEGLVHVKNLKDDRYIYQDDTNSLIGLRYGKVYKVGLKVKVECINASKESMEIDFRVLDTKNDLKKDKPMLKYKKKK